VKERFVRANGLRFHLIEAGAGPLVLLLHGFPECWYSWRHQIPALASRFHVVAPDLRGYYLTDKPEAGYELETLAADVRALIAALGAERAHLVGHDWGGVIAWTAATWYPDAVDRLVVINAPYPAAFLRELRRDPRQCLRIWYIALFWLPGLPEWLLSLRDWAAIGGAMVGSAGRAGVFSADDLAYYRRAIAVPGALSATLRYYRALRTYPFWKVDSWPPIAARTLLLWGERDPALNVGLSYNLEQWVPDLETARFPSVGHWVHEEEPARVTALLFKHLARA
jgi:pimeloyl-ACP methyl ester carboxylesterase